MSTIQVEILPAKSWDKVRVQAFTQCGKSLRTKYTGGYTHEQIIARAAAKLAKRLGWAGEQIRLHSESGRVFAFVSDGALAVV